MKMKKDEVRHDVRSLDIFLMADAEFFLQKLEKWISFKVSESQNSEKSRTLC